MLMELSRYTNELSTAFMYFSTLVFRNSYKFISCPFLQVLEDFDIPAELKDMFVPIPAEKFRMDISSTEIRKTQGLL